MDSPDVCTCMYLMKKNEVSYPHRNNWLYCGRVLNVYYLPHASPTFLLVWFSPAVNICHHPDMPENLLVCLLSIHMPLYLDDEIPSADMSVLTVSSDHLCFDLKWQELNFTSWNIDGMYSGLRISLNMLGSGSNLLPACVSGEGGKSTLLGVPCTFAASIHGMVWYLIDHMKVSRSAFFLVCFSCLYVCLLTSVLWQHASC
jgi:hypothetical protein